jgi:predicted metal-dependent hydrolase
VTKHERIMEFIRQFDDGSADPRYAGYFALFNRQKFYEAHDALENLWLEDRQGANGSFFKGLIQLAGAFVHLQKNRLRPSAALFKLARANFEKYPHLHEQLDLSAVQNLIGHWLSQLENSDFQINPLTSENAPQLNLFKTTA